MAQSEFNHRSMNRALELAARGLGFVEPNPLVGCVIARGEEVVGEGWHQRFGGPHAEVDALRAAAERAAGATMYVTLEPCCHHGRTPPCTEAIIAAGIRRVVAAMRDPFPQVDGGGARQLEAAGIEVEVGLLEDEARELNAPYLKLVASGRPWVIAKWAMSLDGKIATRTGDSRWISGEASRAVAHKLRGRMDAILVGRGTVQADDPQLTARPQGPRTATRIILDTRASLPLNSQLVRTASEAPVIVVAGPNTNADKQKQLSDAGCKVFICDAATRSERISQLLDELGRRRMTSILVEGGAEVLGSFFDASAVDEVHVFIAPKIIGGKDAPTALAGVGIEQMAEVLSLTNVRVDQLDDDLYISARLKQM